MDHDYYLRLKIPKQNLILVGRIMDIPSNKTTRMSLRMVIVVARTNRENKKVQIGSAILNSGCKI